MLGTVFLVLDSDSCRIYQLFLDSSSILKSTGQAEHIFFSSVFPCLPEFQLPKHGKSHRTLSFVYDLLRPIMFAGQEFATSQGLQAPF
jgi:hypothetical protein